MVGVCPPGSDAIVVGVQPVSDEEVRGWPRSLAGLGWSSAELQAAAMNRRVVGRGRWPGPGWFGSGCRRQRRRGEWLAEVAGWGQVGLSWAAGGSDGGGCGRGRGVLPGPGLTGLMCLRGHSGSGSDSGSGSGAVMWCGGPGPASRIEPEPDRLPGRGGVCWWGWFAECRGRCPFAGCGGLGGVSLRACACAVSPPSGAACCVLPFANCRLRAADCVLSTGAVGVFGVSFLRVLSVWCVCLVRGTASGWGDPFRAIFAPS